MKRNGMIGMAVLAGLAFTVSLAAAGPGRGWKGSGGWGVGGGYQRMTTRRPWRKFPGRSRASTGRFL
jgi:hypothetical protein